MYCILVYITYEEFQRQNSENHEDDVFLKPPVVNKELFFNPNCVIGIIFDYLLEQTGIPKELKNKIDLRDENGISMELNRHPPHNNGLEIFIFKKKYNLVLITDDQEILPLIADNLPRDAPEKVTPEKAVPDKN
ncbi:unnamed protein product [Phyllotreta striolata]|uniref:Uncharacterized protein n=1 Tax=Phyllotreta striolata TaxID=444603 RepID=A0A9N9TCV5_PHYSR|nr:unnamed protein product [Phyllotreta striolata]